MKGNIEERACEVAAYIIETKATVRAAAKSLGSLRVPYIKTYLTGFGYAIRRCTPPSSKFWMKTKRSAICGAGWLHGRNIKANKEEVPAARCKPGVKGTFLFRAVNPAVPAHLTAFRLFTKPGLNRPCGNCRALTFRLNGQMRSIAEP